MSVNVEDNHIYYRMINGRILTIRKYACQELYRFRQEKKESKEAGGILLGQIFESSGNYNVDEITTPKKSDRRSRFLFYRSKAHHDIALSRWKSSDGRCIYMGLWHSHPEFDPKPSNIDFNDWKKALKKGKYEGDSLFFLIIGIKELRCWQGVYSHRDLPSFYPLDNIEM